MTTAPYGSWPSPLEARTTFAGSVRRTSPRADGDDLYWLESRPQDAGRVTLVRRSPDGTLTDINRPGSSVRTRYLEYGGGDYAVAGGTVLWVDFDSQRVLMARPGQDVRVLTSDVGGAVRWSCLRLDDRRSSVICLREDQRDPDLEPVNSLVRLQLDSDNPDLGTVLVAGRERRRDQRDLAAPDTAQHPGGAPDFISDPALSPEGGRIAWVAWDHPSMPWQHTDLWIAEVDPDGSVRRPRRAPHPAGTEEQDRHAWEQPTWLDEDTLLVLSDQSGWSNLYRLQISDTQGGTGGLQDRDAAGEASITVRPVTADRWELGIPRWVPDMRAYAVVDASRVVCGRSRDGFREVVVIDLESTEVTPLSTGTSYVRDLVALADGRIAMEAHRAGAPADLMLLDLDTARCTPASGTDAADAVAALLGDGRLADWAAEPESVWWRSDDGSDVHGFLYRPRHPHVQAPDGDRPPLIVTLHGGPTSCATPGFSLARTYWTSRGFAVLDVNYGGSTGFGRAYRERLDGRWGVVDVQDAASGARHLADTGVVDPARLAITGGSAGGYTTLAAATFTSVFAAGASHFGVSDLATLAADTHKLESRYCGGLVGPWPSAEAVYRERSPIHHLDRLGTPLILLQGTEDLVVPPNQAESMAEALRAKGLPVALVLFEGEGHGFRALENQVRALQAEHSFYAQVFGIEVTESLPRVEVENLA